VRALVLCAFTSFMFGWHVHEKAILLVIVPLTVLILYNCNLARIFLILSITGHFSLMPLLFTPFENIIKVVLWIMSTLYTYMALNSIYGSNGKNLLGRIEWFYLIGLGSLGVFNWLGLKLLGLSESLPFLPLLLTSLYCGLGLFYCYIALYFSALSDVCGQESCSKTKTS